MKFKVLRPHQGDKFYEAGDTREASESEVKHLVASGVLEKTSEPKKSEPQKSEAAPKNKAEGRAPKNKGE